MRNHLLLQLLLLPCQILLYVANVSSAAVLPLLAAKQRVTHHNDWMSTDALVACPDPNCPSMLKITRNGTRIFSHAETTVVGLGGNSHVGDRNTTNKTGGERKSSDGTV